MRAESHDGDIFAGGFKGWMARLYEVQRERAQGELGERRQLQHGRVQRVAHRVIEAGHLQFIDPLDSSSTR